MISSLLKDKEVSFSNVKLQALVYEFDTSTDKDPDTKDEEKDRSLDNMTFSTNEVKAAIARVNLNDSADITAEITASANTSAAKVPIRLKSASLSP